MYTHKFYYQDINYEEKITTHCTFTHLCITATGNSALCELICDGDK